MKKVHQWQRILILSMLCFTVFSPLVFVSSRLKYSTLIGRKEFVEDFSSFKQRKAVQLNAVEQETNKDFKVPEPLVYRRKDSLDTYNSSHGNNDSKHSENTGERNRDSGQSESVRYMTNPLQNPGSSHEGKGNNKHSEHEAVVSKSDGQRQPKQTIVQHNMRTAAQRARDDKVKELKDQLIRARAYLSFTPPGSNSHLAKELKLRIKDLERIVSGAKRNSDLSRSALQKIKSMEVSLDKASRVFPHCSSMVTKLRAMTYNAEEQVQAQRNQTTFLVNLAARTTPKGLHCLSMMLTAKYFGLPPERRQFPNQQRAHDPDLHHLAVFSDNILACAVVVNSTVSSVKDSEKIVFHVVTDSLNLPAISMWFLLNPPSKATIQIQSIDNFEWLSAKYNSTVKPQHSHDPRYASALNHLRFYLPDIFPLLNKILFLDHDVVVQRDIGGLWSLNMNGQVNGAVETCQENDASFHRMDMFINFSDSFVTKRFNAETCTWAFGMNLFDLSEWRRQNLTARYHNYLRVGYKRPLWKAGSLPLGWATFYNRTIALDRRWHRLGLGYESAIPQDEIDQAAVLHYDGVRKPWLDIGVGSYKSYWTKYINFDNLLLQQCNIHQ